MLKKIIGVLLVLVMIGMALVLRDQMKQKNLAEADRVQQLHAENEKRKEEKEAAMLEAASVKILANEAEIDRPLLDVVDLQEDPTLGEIIISPADFQKRAKCTPAESTSEPDRIGLYEIDADLSDADMLVLQFTAYSQTRSVKLTVTVGSEATVLQLSPTPTTYYIPVSEKATLNRISFEMNSEGDRVTLDSVYLVNYGEFVYPEWVQGGCFSDTGTEVQVTEADLLSDANTRQCLVRDGTIFQLTDSGLNVYEPSWGNNMRLAAEIPDLGTCRDMAFSEDKNTIYVCSRQCGVYLVDVTKPAEAAVISHFDTLEVSADIAVDGNYLFIAERYCGITVADVSDPENPRFVTTIEVPEDIMEIMDCFVSDGYLYAGVSDRCSVVIFDIRDLTNAEWISTVECDGNVQGVFVRNHILYTATAMSSRVNAVRSEYSFGLGTGNGMEIYDVSDTAEPKLLSTVKGNGRASSGRNNAWDVQVSGDYAFVADQAGGVYVYDVKDPSNPVCVTHYDYLIPEEEEEQSAEEPTEEQNKWDLVLEEKRASAWHAVPMDQKLLICYGENGLALMDCEYASVTADTEPSELTASEHEQVLPESRRFEISAYHTDGSVWSAAATDEFIYLACGEDGIQKLTLDLELVETVETEHSVKDLVIAKNTLVTAESEGGIGIYSITNGIEKISEFIPTMPVHFSALTVSNDGNLVLAQDMNNYHMVIDITNPMEPKSLRRTGGVGSTLYRNVVTGNVSNRYVGVFGSGSVLLYELKNGTLDTVRVPMSYYNERCGVAAAGKQLLGTTNRLYHYADPMLGEWKEFKSMPYLMLNGKASISDTTLAITDLCTGYFVLADISNLDSPKIRDFFQIDGNPDIACFVGEEILIPCRYDGLLKLTPKAGTSSELVEEDVFESELSAEKSSS